MFKNNKWNIFKNFKNVTSIKTKKNLYYIYDKGDMSSLATDFTVYA